MKRDGDTNVEVGTETQKYQPIEARDELPVRISTYYQAGDREGTRLSELEGYTGRLTINVVVQNLTTDITDLSYDVTGQQKMRSGLVGVPLTAVAALETTIPASSIITSDVGGNDGLTNGVVSVKDNMTVIQWAAVMAPPRLPGVTTMTLVADVEEFEVPAINITIQPGYVGDASVPALLRRSFDEQILSENQVITDTIKVLVELDAVLAETGSVIGDTQAALDDAAKTVGSRTIQDLQQSMTSIESSTRAMIGSLDVLNTQMNSSLASMNSTVTGQLSSTLSMMSSLLGSTDRRPPRLDLDGQGCSTRVVVPDGNPSVYDTILLIDALINGYASASASCQAEVVSVIHTVLGPAVPTSDQCTDDMGVTCWLLRSHDEVQDALGQLETTAGNAVLGLHGADRSDRVGF